jgi:hypothetical protein
MADQLGTTRVTEDGVMEILVDWPDAVARWTPLATHLVHNRVFAYNGQFFEYTWAEALEREGWVPPAPEGMGPIGQMSRAIRLQLESHGPMNELPTSTLAEYVTIIGAFFGDLRDALALREET